MGWECVARTRRVEARGNNKKENAIRMDGIFFLVTRTGIEPMFPA